MAVTTRTREGQELAPGRGGAEAGAAGKGEFAAEDPIPSNDLKHPDGYPNLTGDPQSAPRCGAHARTTGKPCKAPAVRGKKRCRMHGGARGSGGQRGNQNAVTSGKFTAKAQARDFMMSLLYSWLHQDGRRERARLTREIELREFLKLLGKWGPATDYDGKVNPMRVLATDIAEDAGIDWTPEA